LGEDETNISINKSVFETKFNALLKKINDLSASQADCDYVGKTLFEELFQKEVFFLLQNSLRTMQEKKSILRIVLRIDASELNALPWEFMYSDRIVPHHLCLHDFISIIRYLPISQTINSDSFGIPLRILILISNPIDENTLNVENEVKNIKKALRSLVWSGDVKINICTNATLENLRAELRHKPDILHFIGHGHYDTKKKKSFLKFLSNEKRSEPIDSNTMCVQLQNSTIKLVILNSCEGAKASTSNAFSGIAQNLIRSGIPYVLAMQFNVSDRTSMWLSSSFYSELITTHSVELAVMNTRKFLASKSGMLGTDWANPVLYKRFRTHDSTIIE
jgi:hypothetical protein